MGEVEKRKWIAACMNGGKGQGVKDNNEDLWLLLIAKNKQLQQEN